MDTGLSVGRGVEATHELLMGDTVEFRTGTRMEGADIPEPDIGAVFKQQPFLDGLF